MCLYMNRAMEKQLVLRQLMGMENKLRASTAFSKAFTHKICLQILKYHVPWWADMEMRSKKAALMALAEQFFFREEIEQETAAYQEVLRYEEEQRQLMTALAKARAENAARMERVAWIKREAAIIRGEIGCEIRWPRTAEDELILQKDDALRRGLWNGKDEENFIPPPPPFVSPAKKKKMEEKAKVVELSKEEQVSMDELSKLEKEFKLDILPLEDGKLKTHLINLFLPKVDGVVTHGNPLIKQRRKALIKSADSVDNMSTSTVDGNVGGKEEEVSAAAEATEEKKVVATRGKWRKRVAKALLAPVAVVAKVAILGVVKSLKLAKTGVMEASRLRFAIYKVEKEYDYYDDETFYMDDEESESYFY